MEGGRYSRTSIRSGWRVSGGHSQALQRRADPRGAARERRAPRQVADDARIRGRPGDDRPSADRDRALRLVERGQAPGGPGSATLRDPRGAARPAARSWARRSAARRPRGTSRRGAADALQVALLAHLRLAHARPARGWIRRGRGRGAARRALDQGVCWPSARPAAEVRRLGRGAAVRHQHADRMAGLPHVRRPPRGLVDVPVPGARAARTQGVEIKGDGTLA